MVVLASLGKKKKKNTKIKPNKKTKKKLEALEAQVTSLMASDQG